MRRLLALVLVSGCGLTITHGPDPRRPPDQRPVCTETFAAPKRDAIGAIVGLATILTGVLFLKYSDSNGAVGAPLIVVGAGTTAGFYISGGVGYHRVKRCQRAIGAYNAPP